MRKGRHPLIRRRSTQRSRYSNPEWIWIHGSIGKRVSIFCSFTDSAQWHDEVFTGLLEVIGDDFVVIKDTALNKSTLIMSVYINYIEITTDTKKK